MLKPLSFGTFADIADERHRLKLDTISSGRGRAAGALARRYSQGALSMLLSKTGPKDLAVPGELARFSPPRGNQSGLLQADVRVPIAGTLASSSFNPSDIVG
jgi:hypothetical protein